MDSVENKVFPAISIIYSGANITFGTEIGHFSMRSRRFWIEAEYNVWITGLVNENIQAERGHN